MSMTVVDMAKKLGQSLYVLENTGVCNFGNFGLRQAGEKDAEFSFNEN